MPERLIVRKLAPKAPIVERAVRLVAKRSNPREVVDEITVDRPRRFALGWKRNIAGYGDGRAIVDAVETMRESVGEGASQYEVLRVKGNGKERDLRFWQGFVDSAKSSELKKLQKEGKRNAKEIIRTARKGQNAEYKDRRNAGDDDSTVSKKATRWSSLLLGVLRRGTPSMVVARELKPGRSVNEMQSSLFGAYSRLQDGILDPMNVFHGLGESLTDKVKELQEGNYRVFVNLFLTAHPKANEAVAGILNFNKLTSRDSEDTKAAVLAYSAGYEKLTTNEKLLIGLPKNWKLGLGRLRLTRGQAFGLVLPSPSQFETATDYNMSLVDKALAVRASQILEAPVTSQYGSMYQLDVAKSVVGALDKVPTDAKLTHMVESRLSELTKRANGLTGGMLSRATDMVGRAAEFLGVKPKVKASEEQTPEEKSRANVTQTIKSMEAALKKPMSIVAYTKAMTEMGEVFLQLKDVTPVEATKWQQAVAWGDYVLGTYDLAKAKLVPTETTL